MRKTKQDICFVLGNKRPLRGPLPPRVMKGEHYGKIKKTHNVH
jgi:hypothetical protein